MKISIILPTRKRSLNLERLFNSILETVNLRNRLEISLRLDEDDKDSDLIIKKFQSKLDLNLFRGPRLENKGFLWNQAWENATGEIFMMCGDDVVFRTPSWDLRIREEFAKIKDRIVFIFGKDGLQNEDLGTLGFIHENWTKTTGYFVPPHFQAHYHDTWNDELARRIERRIFIPELFFEHMHHSVGKSKCDEIYSEMDKSWDRDTKLWVETEQLRREDSEKLKKIIEGFHE